MAQSPGRVFCSIIKWLICPNRIWSLPPLVYIRELLWPCDFSSAEKLHYGLANSWLKVTIWIIMGARYWTKAGKSHLSNTCSPCSVAVVFFWLTWKKNVCKDQNRASWTDSVQRHILSCSSNVLLKCWFKHMRICLGSAEKVQSKMVFWLLKTAFMFGFLTSSRPLQYLELLYSEPF